MNAFEWTKVNYPKINKEKREPVINYQYEVKRAEETKKQTVQKELSA